MGCSTLVVLVYALSAPAPKVEKPVDPFTGTWIVVHIVVNGEEYRPEKTMRLVFKNGQRTMFEGKDPCEPAHQIVHESAKDGEPKRVRFVYRANPNRPPVSEQSAIYRVERDRLIICWQDGPSYPADFESKTGDHRVFISLERPRD